MEDFKEKYTEALEKARGLIDIIGNTTLGNLDLKYEFGQIFPELRESQNEIIRKDIITFFKTRRSIITSAGISVLHLDNWISWLESLNIIDKLDKCVYDNFNEQNNDAIENNQNKTWTEEDKQHIDSLLKRLDGLCRNKFERTRFAISEDRDWLKHLSKSVKKQMKCHMPKQKKVHHHIAISDSLVLDKKRGSAVVCNEAEKRDYYIELFELQKLHKED